MTYAEEAAILHFFGGGQEEYVAETEYLGTPTKIVAKAVMPGTWNMIPRVFNKYSKRL